MGASAAPSSTDLDTLALAVMVRETALAVPGVLGISAGRGFVEATYGRGAMVRGVGISSGERGVDVTIHLIIAQTPIPLLAFRVRQAIRHYLVSRTDLTSGSIDLYIDDMDMSVTPILEEDAV